MPHFILPKAEEPAFQAQILAKLLPLCSFRYSTDCCRTQLVFDLYYHFCNGLC